MEEIPITACETGCSRDLLVICGKYVDTQMLDAIVVGISWQYG